MRRKTLEARRLAIELKLLEDWDSWVNRVVDTDAEFEGWLKIGFDTQDKKGPASLPALSNMRDVTRYLAFENPFAQNAHQNLQHYIVGTGLAYKFVDPKNRKTKERVALQTKALWDKWYEEHHWYETELEQVLRLDRDGEYFLRFFDDIPRWVEPEKIWDPRNIYPFGIIHPEGDEQDVRGYILADQAGSDGEVVEKEDMIHVKANVDQNVLRGLPTFWSIRENLVRAVKLLRNMSKMAEIQSAIAMVREHPITATADSVTAWLDSQADKTPTDQETSKTVRQKKYRPGTIIDVPAGQKYHFPVAGIEAGKLVTVLDAELRCCAARTSMAEFMFSMNAGNSNYASLTAAERPTIKSMKVRQARVVETNRRAANHWLKRQVELGNLPSAALSLEAEVRGPSIKGESEFQDTRAKELRHRNGILSVRTWAEEDGLDYDEELRRNEEDQVILPQSAQPKPVVGKGGKGMNPGGESSGG